MPFEKGGVITQPTNFAMRGATGLMGEAGPEAIIQANIEQGNQDYVTLMVNQDKQKTGQTKLF